MITLETIKLRAQRAANNEGKWMTVWNLNRYQPLYVVRLYQAGDEDKYGFVGRFYPEAIVR